jgi:metal transporter CNNM
MVRLLMLLSAPLSWPIGKALDFLLGKENFVFGKRQIRAFVDLHRWVQEGGGLSSSCSSLITV